MPQWVSVQKLIVFCGLDIISHTQKRKTWRFEKGLQICFQQLIALKQDCVVYVTVLYLSKRVSYRGNNMRWLRKGVRKMAF